MNTQALYAENKEVSVFSKGFSQNKNTIATGISSERIVSACLSLKNDATAHLNVVLFPTHYEHN